MSYEQIMQILVVILPFLVAIIVGFAKNLGLATKYAPALTTTIAVGVALLLYWFYPHVDFETIMLGIMSTLSAGTVYGAKKTISKYALLLLNK